MNWRRDTPHRSRNPENDFWQMTRPLLLLGLDLLPFQSRADESGVFSLKSIYCVHFYPHRLALDLMALESRLNGGGQDAVRIPTFSPRNWSKSSIINWASCLSSWINLAAISQCDRVQMPRGANQKRPKNKMWTFGLKIPENPSEVGVEAV